MKGPRVAASIACLLAAQCLYLPRPAKAADVFTAWYLRDTELVPIMTFADAEACARAAQVLAAKAGTYVGCIAGAPPETATRLPQPPSLDDTFHDVMGNRTAVTTRREPSRQRPAVSCSITGSDIGLTAVCKSD